MSHMRVSWHHKVAGGLAVTALGIGMMAGIAGATVRRHHPTPHKRPVLASTTIYGDAVNTLAYPQTKVVISTRRPSDPNFANRSTTIVFGHYSDHYVVDASVSNRGTQLMEVRSVNPQLIYLRINVAAIVGRTEYHKLLVGEMTLPKLPSLDFVNALLQDRWMEMTPTVFKQMYADVQAVFGSKYEIPMVKVPAARPAKRRPVHKGHKGRPVHKSVNGRFDYLMPLQTVNLVAKKALAAVDSQYHVPSCLGELMAARLQDVSGAVAHVSVFVAHNEIHRIQVGLLRVHGALYGTTVTLNISHPRFRVLAPKYPTPVSLSGLATLMDLLKLGSI